MGTSCFVSCPRWLSLGDRQAVGEPPSAARTSVVPAAATARVMGRPDGTASQDGPGSAMVTLRWPDRTTAVAPLGAEGYRYRVRAAGPEDGGASTYGLMAVAGPGGEQARPMARHPPGAGLRALGVAGGGDHMDTAGSTCLVALGYSYRSKHGRYLRFLLRQAGGAQAGVHLVPGAGRGSRDDDRDGLGRAQRRAPAAAGPRSPRPCGPRWSCLPSACATRRNHWRST